MIGRAITPNMSKSSTNCFPVKWQPWSSQGGLTLDIDGSTIVLHSFFTQVNELIIKEWRFFLAKIVTVRRLIFVREAIRRALRGSLEWCHSRPFSANSRHLLIPFATLRLLAPASANHWEIGDITEVLRICEQSMQTASVYSGVRRKTA